MKVIIAGSRSIKDYGFIKEAVEASGLTITEVVSGTAAGVDKLGEKYAELNDIPVKQFPADWKNINVPGAVIRHNRYGAYNAVAGHQRNAQMAEYAEALVAVWDGSSKGTWDMMSRMKAAGKQVFVYNIKEI